MKVDRLILLAIFLAALGCASQEAGNNETSNNEREIQTVEQALTGDAGTCNLPTGISSWGEPCDFSNNCCQTPDTYCVAVSGMPKGYGVCAPLCCTGDDSYCSDVGPGQETCLIETQMEGKSFCAIECNSNSDCLSGMKCRHVESIDKHICFPGTSGIPGAALFVGNGYYAQEDVLIDHLTVNNGFQVEKKKDYRIRSDTDLTPYDLIVITGFAPNISNAGLNNIKSSGVPVLIVEYWDFWYSYKFGLVDDDWCGTMYSTGVELTDNQHEITASLSNQETVYEMQSVMIGVPMYSISQNTVPLIYSTTQYNQATVLVNDSINVVASGIHEADRYTAAGWEIFDNAVAYLTK
ncbi:MAG: hypothetical protein GY854_28635 [Deltaproteobacteria bacterium]|nr:hypothetical protein [Deltaproteobacteria bacterium]